MVTLNNLRYKWRRKDLGLDLDDLEEAASIVTTEENSPSKETGAQQDPRGQSHHDDSLQPEQHHHQQQPDEVVHQMGYPDLIQKSMPGPDIVTTHVVRTAAEVEDARRHNGIDMEQGCSPEEDDESDEDSNIDDDEESGTDDDEAGDNDCKMGGDCSEHSSKPAASTLQSSLESDFVDKVTIATSETESDAFRKENKAIHHYAMRNKDSVLQLRLCLKEVILAQTQQH